MTTDEFIPFHRPSLGPAEREAVMAVLDSGWLTTGSRAAAFRKAARMALRATAALW